MKNVNQAFEKFQIQIEKMFLMYMESCTLKMLNMYKENACGVYENFIICMKMRHKKLKRMAYVKNVKYV